MIELYYYKLPEAGHRISDSFTIKYCTKYYWLTCWVWLCWQSHWTIEYIRPLHSVEAALSPTTLLTSNSTQLGQKAASWLSKAAALSLTRPLNTSWLSTPSTNSARIWWAAATPASPTNSARICWAAATMTQQGCWVWILLRYVQNRGTQYKSNWISSTSSARICWAYHG